MNREYKNGMIGMYNIIVDLLKKSCDFGLTKNQFVDVLLFKMQEIKKELEN